MILINQARTCSSKRKFNLKAITVFLYRNIRSQYQMVRWLHKTSLHEKDHFASMLIFQWYDRARRTLSGASISSLYFPILTREIILSADLSVPPKWITWTYKHARVDEKSRTACYANRVSAWKRRRVVKFEYDAWHRFKIDYGTHWRVRTFVIKDVTGERNWIVRILFRAFP